MADFSYRRPSILDCIPHDGHAVIEADAGAGKTHTIEHLVLDLLLSTSTRVEEILVMTFTEKATTELRKRIRDLLETILSGPAAVDESADDRPRTIDDDGRRKLEEALFSFDRAPIHTIHGFCQRVLTDFAFHSGTRFDLELVESRAAFHGAFRAELRESLALDDRTRTLLSEWLDGEDKTERGSLIDSLESLLYEAHRNRYLDSGAPRENQIMVANLAKTFDAAALKQAFSSLKRPSRETAIAAADSLASLIRTPRKDRSSLREALSSFDFSKLPAAEKLDDGPGKKLAEAIDVVRCAVALEVRILDSFLPPITERLSREKRENGQIDYDDMLAWVWKALEGPRGGALASGLRERWRYALVDEFQDTDDLQWRILRRVFVESGGKCFLHVVGDPKQAIYAFRGADVFTYLRARDELKKLGVASVPLTKNFRSTADVVDACNLILDQQAGAAIFRGPICYDKPAQCGRPDLCARDSSGNSIKPVTVFHYLPSGGKASAAQMRAAMGRKIAAEIQRILSAKHRIVIRDKDVKERTVKPDGIFVLTRTRAESLEIGGYLREADVPFAFYKQDGLFQTDEARDILDVLKAVEEPETRSRRLSAWLSPFFAIPFEQLAAAGEIPAGHPLNERLFEWNALARDEEFAELFDRLLHESGLVDRELMLSNSERKLTNYLHIFEVLLQDALSERLSLADIVARLDFYIAKTSAPGGADANTQRIESERRAVQVMTVHLSKGLEADIVFLFGGTSKPPSGSKVAVYHDGYERRLAVGKASKGLVKDSLTREERQEDARLIYVALTRARARLYLPLFSNGTTKKPINGYYAPLNSRLETLLAESDNRKRERLFAIEDVSGPANDCSDAIDLSTRLKTWSPPESLLGNDADRESEGVFENLRRRHAPMITCSYTTLGRFAAAQRGVELDDLKYESESTADGADLAGGRRVGIFLHQVIERLDLESLAPPVDLTSWKNRPEVGQLIAETMRRTQVGDPRWADRGAEIVFNALRSPVAIRDGVSIEALCETQNVREMEFIYPIPEQSHPLLAAGLADSAWTVHRGYLKGFVDFVFEHRGLTYFADWKSDLLQSYEPSVVEAHVRRNYDLQAAIYSVGIVRLLRVRDEDDYRRRFGGLLYLFIRGMRDDGTGRQGVYFHRPSWAEITRYETDLIRLGSGS